MALNDQVNVLHVTPFLPPDKGGIANVVLNLCTNLSRQGVNVSVIAPQRMQTKYSKIPEDEFLVKKIKSIYLPGWPYPTLRSFSIPLDGGRSIKYLIKNQNIDIVHIHGHHYPICWTAASIASTKGIPVVLSLHGMYGLNPHVLGGKSKIEDIFNRVIFSRLLKKCTIVMGGTDTITEYARKFALGPQYLTIPNGVNTKTFIDNLDSKNKFRYELNFGKNNKIILFVGRFESVKGILEFSKACKNMLEEINNVEIVVVGSGVYQDQVNLLLGNSSRAHLLGWQGQDKIHEIFIAADIYALPSTFEALPLTVLEAMNAGLHIVYTPVGGVSDILSGYSYKTMIRKVSSLDIKASLEKALNSQLSEEELKSSLDYARKFDWGLIASRIYEIYRDLVVPSYR